MLILSRHQHQIIRIGDLIKVMILAISNGRVELGIDAPKKVPVHREEVYQKLQAQNRTYVNLSSPEAEKLYFKLLG